MRSRNLKPGFFKNEQLAEMPAEARLLFAGLWCMADREGRLEDRPKRIKIELFPGDSFDIDRLLERLQSGGLITRYQCGDLRCIQVLNFEKHQHPHHKEPPSTLPKPGASPGPTGAGDDKSPGVASDKKEPDPSATRLIPDSGSRIPDSRLLIPENSPAASARPPPNGGAPPARTLPGGVVLTAADLKRLRPDVEPGQPRFPLKGQGG